MRKILFSAVLGFSALCFGAGQDPFALKIREPNWRADIVKSFTNGAPNVILFYQPRPDGSEMPVKQINFYENGAIQVEMDVAVVAENAPGALLWKANVVPHGVRAEFSPEGVVVRLARYEEGLPEGESRTFYANGKPALIESFAQGKRSGLAKAFFEEGELKEEITYANDVPHGDFIQYTKEGGKSSLIPYVDGKVHGKALEWYPDGSIRTQRQFANGVIHGDGKTPAVIGYDEKHNIAEVVDFRDGKAIGTHSRYHPNKREAYRVQFKNGLKVGKELLLAEDGAVLGEGIFLEGKPKGKHWRKHANGKMAFVAEYDGDGNLVKPIAEYDEKGQLLREYRMVDGKLDGECAEWFPNGQIKSEYAYNGGDLEGEQREYYPSGQIKTRSHYKNKERDGVYEQWAENGILLRKYTFAEGVKNGLMAEWYPNGNSKIDAFYQADYPDGVQTEWHENGQLKMRNEYAAGLKEGWQREWNKEGELIFEGQYKNDFPEGTILTWWRQNQIRSRLFFTNGKKEGKQEWFYENGKPEKVASFHEDAHVGELLSWYADGSIQAMQLFKGGKPIGEHREYFPKSEAHQKDEERLARILHYDDEGRLHGVETSFYPDGKKQTVVFYDHGVLDGLKKMWGQDGAVVEEAEYVKGKLEGRFFQKLPDGRELVYTYENNLKNGPHQVFYPVNQSGQKVKALETTYENDVIHGLLIEYSDHGVKIGETPHVKGEKVGEARLYGLDGKLRLTIAFARDLQNGPMIHYFPDGSIFRETPYVAGKREGEEKTYHEDGSLAGVCLYKNDLLEGTSRSWNTAGILTFEAEYKGGQRHGVFKKYYDDGSPYLMQHFAFDQPDGEKAKYSRDGQRTVSRYEAGKLVHN